MTIGELIEALADTALSVPGGWDAEVVAGVCDGHGLATTPRIEVTALTRVPATGGPQARVGLIRVHAHGDDVTYLPGVAEAVDDESP